jgi:hypothetical protein
MNKLPFVKPIWAAQPKNYTGAAMTAKWVSLKDAAHIRIVIQSGAWAAGTAAVTLAQATAVAGTGTKALAFAKMWTDSAATGTLVETAVTSNTFNIDTADSLYIIEVDSASLDTSGGFDCLTLAVASPGANADFYGVTYLLEGLRYAQATPPSALTD